MCINAFYFFTATSLNKSNFYDLIYQKEKKELILKIFNILF